MPNATPTTGERVKFKAGTYAEYSALASKDANTIYFCTDTRQIFVGGTEYARASSATQSADGLMSSTDKAKLDGIVPADLLTNSDIVVCTQQEYDAMQTRAGLLYFIKEES